MRLTALHFTKGSNRHMAVIYRETDGDLGLLVDKTIGVIGYGNMGRAVALNLRDSAFSILVGNPDDEYAQEAYRDGFQELKGNKQVCETTVVLSNTLLLADRSAIDCIIEAIAKIHAHSAALAS